MRLVSLLLLIFSPILLNGQCPNSDFVATINICKDQEIALTNNSLNSESYEWDFCSGDLTSNVPVASIAINSSENLKTGLSIKKVGANWYGFMVSLGDVSIVRLDFGSSLKNDPSKITIASGGILDNPYHMSIIESGGMWFGLVTNFASSADPKLVLVSFGTDIENESPDLSAVTITGDVPNRPRNIDVIEDGGNYYAITANFNSNNATFLDFGNSLTTGANGANIPLSGQGLGAKFVQDCGTWYGYFTSNQLQKVTFGSDLTSIGTTVTDIVLDNPISDGTSINSLEDGDGKYFILGTRSGDIHRIDLGSDYMASSANSTNIGDLSIFNDLIAFGGAKDSSRYVFYGADLSSSSVYQVLFENDCNVSTAFSTEEVPNGVTYSDAGTYSVTLRAYDNEGRSSWSSQEVTVLDQVAPDIAFSSGINRCISNSNTFTPSITGMTSYSWDFNGDGIEDSDEESPVFDYSGLGAGTYTVRLDVSDGSCSNFYEEGLTMYDDPPVPNFDVTSPLLCTNGEISFANLTDETGYDDAISYEWDFNGESTSTDTNSSFVFTTPGSKTITLRATVTGCEEIYQEVIEVNEGPVPLFSYTNNCFGEAIQFQDESTGGISNSWDFGDGSPTVANSSSPTHTFASAGSYTVSLLVTNSSGCETTYIQDIEVTSDPLVDFTYSLATENLPITFTTIDNSLSDDSIVSWEWDFAGQGTSEDQLSQFIFDLPGTYSVTLTVTTSQGCSDTVLKEIVVSESTCPSPSFEIGDVCIGENLSIVNTSVNSTSYEWDFCSGDLVSSAPEATLVASVTESLKTGLTIEKVGTNWYGFIVSLGEASIIRLDFGSSLKNDPSMLTIATEGLLLDPYHMSIIESGGMWYGLVTNFATDADPKLVLVSFGTDIENVNPDLSAVTITGDVPDRPRNIDVIEDGGNYYAITANFNSNNATFLDFGSSLTTGATGTSIPLSGQGLGAEFVEDCGAWYGYFTSNQLQKVTLGSDLTSIGTTVTDIVLDNPITDGSSITSFADDNDKFLILGSRSGDIHRIDLGADYSGSTASSTNLSDLMVFNDLVAFGGAQDSSSFVFYGANLSLDNVYRVLFENECNVSTVYSMEEVPNGVTYSDAGTYSVTLRAYDDEGRLSRSFLEVTVLDQTAPDISFSPGLNRCVSNPIIFTPTIAGLTSYSWDFDGDGTEDSNLENPSFDYSSLGVGTYTVRLDVSDGACSNFSELAITIYNEPPVPSFEITSTLFCIDTDINFANTTDDATYSGPLSYSWEFIDDATSSVVGTSEQENPSFAFSSAGNKTVRLTSSIPGCEEIVEQSIIINPGPTPNFSATSVCQDESMQFTNQSTNAVSYFWDFGDGFTSTSENPSHVYTTAGNYDVSLTATSANGCDSEITIEVSVSDIPQVNFDFEVPCNTESGVTFTDLSTVNNADIVGWQWYVEGIEVSTEQNPTLNFAETGVINVSLAVTSSNGCESTYNEDIEIQSSPSPDFSSTIGCVGEETSFNDMTVSSSTIISWLWFVDGVSYTTENVSHVFDDFGSYEVSLEVTSQNFCAESITKTIEILQPPTVGFSMDGDCDNVLIEVLDLSTEFNDPIISRTWRLNDEEVGNGSLLYLNQLESESYTLTLEVLTESGCISSMSQPLEINDSPTSSFTSSRTYGLPNDQLTFTNTSDGATAFEWLLNGEPAGNDPNAETYLFSDAGTHVVGLVALNSLGCVDTTNQEILIEVPEIDLSIGSFDLVQENNTGKIFLEIQNLSNLPVESFEAQIVLENQFAVTEQINTFIDIGETTLVSLNVGIPLITSEPAYFCVSLSSPYADYEDLNPIDNEKCLTIQPKVRVEDPFPNPVSDEFRLKVIVPNDGSVKLTLLNSAGKIQTERIYSASTGLNNFIFDMSLLDPGIYYITVDVNGELTQRKVIKL